MADSNVPSLPSGGTVQATDYLYVARPNGSGGYLDRKATIPNTSDASNVIVSTITPLNTSMANGDNVNIIANKAQGQINAFNTSKGAANGIATLDSNSKLTLSQVPTNIVTSVNNHAGPNVNLAGVDIKITDCIPQNVAIAPNDDVEVIAGKTQGQINNRATLISSPTNNNLVSMSGTGNIKDAAVQISTDTMFSANSDSLLPTQRAVKAYVEAFVQGLATKTACLAGTTTNITLSGAQTIDGISSLITGDRVLVKAQTAQQENGIYIYNSSGAWTRSADADAWNELVGAYTYILQGTTLGSTGWICNVSPGGILGTTPVTFGQFAGAGSITAGTGISITGNIVSLTDTGITASTSNDASKTFNATWNAQGQLTSFTPIAIAITGSQVTDFIDVQWTNNKAQIQVDINDPLLQATKNDIGQTITIERKTAGALSFFGNLQNVSAGPIYLTAKEAYTVLAQGTSATIGNANFSFVTNPTTRTLVLNATIGQDRIYTLPAASSYKAGECLKVVDATGEIGATNFNYWIYLTATGGDLINGQGTISLQTGFFNLMITSDGVSRWTIGITPNSFLANMAPNTIKGNNGLLSTSPSDLTMAQLHAMIPFTTTTTFNNGNYTFVAGIKTAIQIGTITATRTVTLPLANTLTTGEELWVIDKSGTVNSNTPIIISCSGSDKINNSVTAFTMNDANNAFLRFVSDGNGNYTINMPGTSYGQLLIISASFTLTNQYKYIICNNTTNITVTLPTPSGYAGKDFNIKRKNTGLVTISGTIDGASSILLNYQYASATLVSDGSTWNLM